MAECTVEASLRRFDKAFRCPEQRLCVQRSVDGCRIVSGKETCLQLADPIPARSERQPGVAREATLHLGLIELCPAKAAESRRRAAECADQRKLGRDVVNHETEVNFPCKRQASLGFALRFGERITGR